MKVLLRKTWYKTNKHLLNDTNGYLIKLSHWLSRQRELHVSLICIQRLRSRALPRTRFNGVHAVFGTQDWWTKLRSWLETAKSCVLIFRFDQRWLARKNEWHEVPIDFYWIVIFSGNNANFGRTYVIGKTMKTTCWWGRFEHPRFSLRFSTVFACLSGS